MYKVSIIILLLMLSPDNEFFRLAAIGEDQVILIDPIESLVQNADDSLEILNHRRHVNCLIGSAVGGSVVPRRERRGLKQELLLFCDEAALFAPHRYAP